MKNRLLTVCLLLLFCAAQGWAAQQIELKTTSLPPGFTHGDFRGLVEDNIDKSNANTTELYRLAHDSYSTLQEYDDGDVVTSGHVVYISIQDNNLGHPVTDALWWTQQSGGGGGIDHAASDAHYYASHNGAWARIPYADILGTPDLTTKQDADADLTTAAGADAAGNSTYFGKDSGGAVGFFSLPSGGGGIDHAASDAHYYASHNGAWARMPYADIVGTPDLTTKQDADADLTTAAGADAAGNSTYFGKDSGGTVGFFALPSGGGTDDQVAAEVPFTPNGSISSTDVQAAIQEVRDEAGGGGSPASETVAGIAEIATNAEVDTGTDNGRIVSPAGLAHAFQNKAFSLAGAYSNLLWNTGDNLINDTSGDNHHLWSASQINIALNGRQAADADLTTAAGADAASNNTYFGKNASGTVGFFAVSGGGGSGNVTLSEGSGAPTAGALPEGSLYHDTDDHTLFLQTATGLLHSGAWTWTANQAVTRTLSITDPGNGDVITCSDADLSAAINCGDGNTDCSATTNDNAVISGLTGTAAAGRHWTAWTGDLTGTAYDNGTVTMDANKTGTATFAQDSAGNEVFAWTGDTSNDADTPAGSTATVHGSFTRTATAAHTGANGGDTVNSTAENGLSFGLPSGYDPNRGTWTVWVNPNDVATDFRYIDVLGVGDNTAASLYLYMEGGDVTATINGDATQHSAYITTGTVGTWMKITVRWLMNDADGYLTLDVDGTSMTADIVSDTFANTPTNLCVGSCGNDTSWDVYIDDEYLYQSDTEVLP